MNFHIVNDNPNTSVLLTQTWEGELLSLGVEIQSPAPFLPKPISIDFSFDCIDVYSVFSPTVDLNTALSYDWAKTTSISRIYVGTPIHALLALSGENRLTIAVDDGLTPISISSGVREEDATMACRVCFFVKSFPLTKVYRSTIRLDFRKIPFYRAVQDAVAWQSQTYLPATPPPCAYDPVFSTWYCYHQNLNQEDIVKECAKARKLGLKTLILDDGWQTEDSSRGYAFCGDWEVAKSKIADMKAFARAIHNLDMKAMVWFSLPYIGSKAKAFPSLKAYVLEDLPEDFEGQATLDPRFPFVREHLENTVVNFFKENDLDGLKLDFIEAFAARKATNERKDGWDVDSVEEAVEKLLRGIYTRIIAVKPDAMIEFRQPYLSPVIRQFGNVFRVSDCPDDMMKNRFYSVNLRLVLGNSAVHSDMLLWNEKETDGGVFRQLCSVLFTTPQISMKPSTLSPSHKQVLETFLNYHEQNRETLLKGDLECSRPEAHYAWVSATGKDKKILLAYLPTPLPLADEGETDILNCTTTECLCLQASGKEYLCQILDIFGQMVEEKTLLQTNGYLLLQAPKECYIHIKRVR